MNGAARNRLLKPMLWVLCLLPFASIVLGSLQARLGANPVERVTHRTGLATLVLLLAGLAITPLRRLTGLLWMVQYRRLIGLFAFFYASLHLLTYLWLDQSFRLGAIVHDVARRPFILLGMTGFALLAPLAATSTRWAQRRLGKNWQRLHRLVYLAAACGALHFLWLVKRDRREPLVYLSVLALLLGWRIVLRFLPSPSGRPAVHPVRAAD